MVRAPRRILYCEVLGLGGHSFPTTEFLITVSLEEVVTVLFSAPSPRFRNVKFVCQPLACKPGPFESGPCKSSTIKSGALQFDLFQRGPFKSGAFKSGPFKSGAFKSGAFRCELLGWTGFFLQYALQLGSFQSDSRQAGFRTRPFAWRSMWEQSPQ